ncbi:MAG: phosphatase PAP2 family protein [Alphaproteobacteria bacterium]|nr:phosphatase PAP2 family protein [Alphaproteobacteria bacterium]
MRLLTSLSIAIISAALAASAHASPDRVRFLEGASAATLTPEQQNETVKGYLTPGAVDITLVPAPPAIDSAQDKVDVAWLKGSIARANAERWAKAVADDASVYDNFSEALGATIDRQTLPRLVRLLNRVSEDALATTTEAKKRFSRPRPFQRFALARVCGQAKPPKPEASPTKGTSYPSGHAVVSWAAALVMMEAAPANATPIVTRAVSYGESRVVCGVHFPSDVESGRILGAAVVDKLFTIPEFRRDLICAKREVQAVMAGQKSEDLPACQ